MAENNPTIDGVSPVDLELSDIREAGAMQRGAENRERYEKTREQVVEKAKTDQDEKGKWTKENIFDLVDEKGLENLKNNDSARRLNEYYGKQGMFNWHRRLAEYNLKGKLDWKTEAIQKFAKVVAKTGITGGLGLAIAGILAGSISVALSPVFLAGLAGAGLARAGYEAYRSVKGKERNELQDIEKANEAVLNMVQELVNELVALREKLREENPLLTEEQIENSVEYKSKLFEIIDILKDDTKRRAIKVEDEEGNIGYVGLKAGEETGEEGIVNVGEMQARAVKEQHKQERYADIAALIGGVGGSAWEYAKYGSGIAAHAGKEAAANILDKAGNQPAGVYNFDKIASPDGNFSHMVQESARTYFDSAAHVWHDTYNNLFGSISKIEAAKEALNQVKIIIGLGVSGLLGLAPNEAGRLKSEQRIENAEKSATRRVKSVEKIFGGREGNSIGGDKSEELKSEQENVEYEEFVPAKFIVKISKNADDRKKLGFNYGFDQFEFFNLHSYYVSKKDGKIIANLKPVIETKEGFASTQNKGVANIEASFFSMPPDKSITVIGPFDEEYEKETVKEGEEEKIETKGVGEVEAPIAAENIFEKRNEIDIEYSNRFIEGRDEKEIQGLEKKYSEDIRDAANKNVISIEIESPKGHIVISEPEKQRLSFYRQLAEKIGYEVGEFEYDFSTGKVNAPIRELTTKEYEDIEKNPALEEEKPEEKIIFDKDIPWKYKNRKELWVNPLGVNDYNKLEIDEGDEVKIAEIVNFEGTNKTFAVLKKQSAGGVTGYFLAPLDNLVNIMLPSNIDVQSFDAKGFKNEMRLLARPSSDDELVNKYYKKEEKEIEGEKPIREYFAPGFEWEPISKPEAKKLYQSRMAIYLGREEGYFSVTPNQKYEIIGSFGEDNSNVDFKVTDQEGNETIVSASIFKILRVLKPKGFQDWIGHINDFIDYTSGIIRGDIKAPSYELKEKIEPEITGKAEEAVLKPEEKEEKKRITIGFESKQLEIYEGQQWTPEKNGTTLTVDKLEELPGERMRMSYHFNSDEKSKESFIESKQYLFKIFFPLFREYKDRVTAVNKENLKDGNEPTNLEPEADQAIPEFKNDLEQEGHLESIELTDPELKLKIKFKVGDRWTVAENKAEPKTIVETSDIIKNSDGSITIEFKDVNYPDNIGRHTMSEGSWIEHFMEYEEYPERGKIEE